MNLLDCPCDMCEARAKGLHPWLLLWSKTPQWLKVPKDFWEGLLHTNPGKPIFWYEEMARMKFGDQFLTAD